MIREGFVKADLIECVIVLPSKIFYGNSVPACLVVLNKRKTAERQGKILFVWASRPEHCQLDTPQNILRRVDCMRILVAWHAFGDLERYRALIPEHEQALLAEIEMDLELALEEIKAVYGPLLAPRHAFAAELSEREASAGAAGNKESRERKKENAERIKELRRELKTLERLESEVEEKCRAARIHAEREAQLAREVAGDLRRICADEAEARRHFAVSERGEIESNEFNLNLPRYVDTFAPQEPIEIGPAVAALESANERFDGRWRELTRLLQPTGARPR